MVFLTKVVFRKPASLRYDQRWIDRVRLHVTGGAGGNGIPRVGGIGGAGGNVIIRSNDKIKELKKVAKAYPNKRVKAEDGGHSRKLRLIGEPGSDVIVEVPVGISVTTDFGEQLADLCESKDEVIVAKGGMGGIESSQYLGCPGEKRSVRLNLKLLGDVGFVGFPNAGKSTLLKAISRARPKIASYPFTTLRPNLGICEYKDLRRISFVDLPGLIEGAHENLGMGHSFLKHVERTRVLLFVVDINGFQFKTNSPVRDALQTILILNKELELYKEELTEKPAVCAITKMDSKGAETSFKKLKEYLGDIENVIKDPSLVDPQFVPSQLIKFADLVPISAKFSPKSVKTLKHRVRKVIDDFESVQSERMLEDLNESVDVKLSEKSMIF